ncbi:MAG TPA: polyhydroxyalkanoic acid system family protein, partial [Longimicrobium sp.]|nr:polyhydroxyalkanoic acid system family protein [Longimicrobium sp.]
MAHELGKEEALARLKALTAHARTVSDLKGDWEAGTLDFSVTAQGLRIVARLTVGEDRLTFDGTLPLIAMPFKSWIPRVLKKSLE